MWVGGGGRTRCAQSEDEQQGKDMQRCVVLLLGAFCLALWPLIGLVLPAEQFGMEDVCGYVDEGWRREHGEGRGATVACKSSCDLPLGRFGANMTRANTRASAPAKGRADPLRLPRDCWHRYRCGPWLLDMCVRHRALDLDRMHGVSALLPSATSEGDRTSATRPLAADSERGRKPRVPTYP